MQFKEFVTSIIKNDKQLLLDQQLGMAFIDVNRMQESHRQKKQFRTESTEVVEQDYSESATQSFFTKNSNLGVPFEYDQNQVMNQIIAKFHQDYGRAS